MGAQTTTGLFDKLQVFSFDTFIFATRLTPAKAEFSPPLDTSLIAAIVADYMIDNKTPSVDELSSLRRILAELASQAEQDEDTLSYQLSNAIQFSTTEDTTSINATDIFSVYADGSESVAYTATTSDASSSSNSSAQSFSTPLGFLQAAFPHLPVSRLKSALGSAQDAEEIDMEAVVEGIMATEFVKELEERGIEDEEADFQPIEWETVTVKKSKRKQKPGKTITFGDVRQKQYAHASSSAPSSPRLAAPDPWTQVSSVAAHLSTLLPLRPPSYFQSLFHSPKHSSPSVALRSALSTIATGCSSMSPTGLSPEDAQSVFSIFDIITSDESILPLTDIDRQQLMSDIQLALMACLAAKSSRESAASASLEILALLRELDTNEVDWGVYHSPAPKSAGPTGKAFKSKHALTLPLGPPSPPKVRQKSASAPSPSPLSPRIGGNVDAWKTIPVTVRQSQASQHANFIPAYAPPALNKKGKPIKKAVGIVNGDDKKDVLDPRWHRRRAGVLMEKRREALMEASRAWQRGNAKTRGGEVAFVFAERDIVD
ncbi:hypothetical protein PHLCEN_2v6028 [Hermanssonia centrifuga]|uniref:Uncharacterized protein n=1 Tax=Hermanssonia centrifuga TaxID=98765 RepID=A0A2R6P0M9_9APHY|nr:hypothetical protein PHLCEN_2v6028 [Hermanssonia centrifuga]